MSYKAIELFPDWYSKAVNRDVSLEETALRKSAIDAIGNLSDKETWIKFLDVYLGISDAKNPSYADVLGQVKGADPNFPLQGQHLVRLLAGMAIVNKIGLDDDWLCPWLALALMTIEIIKVDAPQYGEIINFAKSYYFNECEVHRRFDSSYHKGPKLKSIAAYEIPELHSDNSSTNKAHSDGVIKAFTQVQKDLSATISEVNTTTENLDVINRRLKVIAEETDILWWLYAGYSETISLPFKKIKTLLLPFLVASELSEITTIKPGIGKCKSVISKAIENGHGEGTGNATLEDLITATSEVREIERVFPNLQSAKHFTPILAAIEFNRQYAESEWKIIYKTIANIDFSQAISYEDFALQVYQERMLLEIYGVLK